MKIGKLWSQTSEGFKDIPTSKALYLFLFKFDTLILNCANLEFYITL